MSRLDELIAAIGSVDSPWHDYNREIAWDIVASLSATEWVNLSEVVHNCPPDLQLRFIDAIGNEMNTFCVEILKSLLLSKDFDVSGFSVNALALENAVLSKEFEAPLVRLVERNGGFSDDAQVLLSLMDRR